MIITINREKAAELARSSAHKAVKWLTDGETKITYFWRPEDSTHADAAKLLSVEKYEKGIAVIEQ